MVLSSEGQGRFPDVRSCTYSSALPSSQCSRKHNFLPFIIIFPVMSQIREKPLVETNEEKSFVSLTKLDTDLVSPRAYGREAVLIATSRSTRQSALVAFRKIRAYSPFCRALSAGCKQYGERQLTEQSVRTPLCLLRSVARDAPALS